MLAPLGGTYTMRGVTANGAPYYVNADTTGDEDRQLGHDASSTSYLVYDPDCDGLGSAPMWVVMRGAPDRE